MELIKEVGSGSESPIVGCGDFNEIMYSFKKSGGQSRDEKNGSFSRGFRRMSTNRCGIFGGLVYVRARESTGSEY